MTKDQIKLIIHNQKEQVMNKQVTAFVGFLIVAILVIMVACNEKHPELNYPESPVGLVSPPRPNDLPTFEIPYALVREACGIPLNAKAGEMASVKDGAVQLGVAQDFVDNVHVSIAVIDQGNKTVDMKYQDINKPTGQCSGTRVCTFRCGKTIYRITNIPDQCSCSYDDGEMMILCNEDCPSYELTCKTKAY